MIFVNLSNHPSCYWSEEQLLAARNYGEIVDVPFPVVEPEWDASAVKLLAVEMFNTISLLGSAAEVVVHLMGEQTFCYELACKLQKAGYLCVASTTHRETMYLEDGSKLSNFKFVHFREY